MYYTQPETRVARKSHVCMNCGETINPGDPYERWMSIGDDRKASVNKMHPECLEDLARWGDGEYTPFSGDRPRAIDSAVNSQ